MDAVIGVVRRYGIKRATMDELARHSGVSRQTLYDRYGDKDGVIAAAIHFSSSRSEEALKVEFAQATSLAEKIEAYYAILIWPVYDLMCAMPDAADLETGLGAESTAASRAATRRRQEMLVDMLKGQVEKSGLAPEQVAVFFDQSCGRAKMSSEGPEDLAAYLAVLKDAILALSEHPGGQT
jgi:AcrR family transcriptional regulator